MKLRTVAITVTLTALSIFFTEPLKAYSCEVKDNTPAQTLKTIRDDRSGLIFEVASNYRAVASGKAEAGVWKEIYIMEPTAYCYLQIPNSVESSEALMGANYVFIQLFSGDVRALLGQDSYREISINGNYALVGNSVIAINRPDGQYWAVIYDTTSDNLDYASDDAKFLENNKILLQQIIKSLR